MTGFYLRRLMAMLAVALTFGVLMSPADARVGGGFSMGSRGTRTFSAPPPTSTAPSTAAPIQRSITQPATPGGFGSAPAGGGLFGRPGLLGGLAAGFLGAGLFGMLFGHGLFGGLGGFASLLGLILQIGLVVVIGRFLWSMWQRRQPAFAGGPALRTVGGSGFGAAPGATASARVEITPADFDVFERLLGEIQTAYSDEDLNGLRARVTPEMLSYFSEQLSENVSRGVVNKISGVRLLQGDLAEAWRENGVDYASVAMRFALVDRTLERASGRLVDGSESPQEVTEVWTFMRAGSGGWLLSAIQQT
ncbi:MAG TPA: TIM44-like domain-containing protein [Xanthobacteraceae bacterium]|jgi:predicted lipid-binding transport protein (Tim44 family)